VSTRPPKRRKPLLSHPQDIHCVVYHLLALVAYGSAFWLYLHPEVAGITGPWSRVAFVLAAAVMLGWISGIDVGVNFHNHAHRPVFTRPWMNRWFGRIWPLSGGWPSFFWWYAHVVVHHTDLLGPTDWTLPHRRADGRFEGIYRYSLLHWPWRYARHLPRDFRAGRGGENIPRQAVKEFVIFLVLWSIPFWIDPLMALGLWVLPQWIGNVVIMGPGMYAQHAGCELKTEEKPYSHSNTYLSRFFNMTMFNIGYHIEHHDYPQVHWSELPAFHQKMLGEILPKGGHMLPFGYYRASRLLSPKYTRAARERARREFEEPVLPPDLASLLAGAAT
jgi:fatty acid desaturase